MTQASKKKPIANYLSLGTKKANIVNVWIREKQFKRFLSIYFYVIFQSAFVLPAYPGDHDFNKPESTLSENASTQVSIFLDKRSTLPGYAFKQILAFLTK